MADSRLDLARKRDGRQAHIRAGADMHQLKADLAKLAAHPPAEFYSHVVNWFDPITGESCVIGG
jgi:hypothetical protein